MAGRLVLGPRGEVFEVNSTDHLEEVGLYGQLVGIRHALAAGRKPAAGAPARAPRVGRRRVGRHRGRLSSVRRRPEDDHRPVRREKK